MPQRSSPDSEVNVTAHSALALHVRAVSKSFPGTRALDAVDLEVRAGEIHALVGHNGSGKSTLVKVLAGFHAADPGCTAGVGGAPVDLTLSGRRDDGVRFVHQNSGLVEALSVADNFRLTARRRAMSRLDRRAEAREAQAALIELGYDIDPVALVGTLSAAERTAVALARALDDWLRSVHLVVLDEVTASLPGPEIERLLAALRRVRASGVAVLFISHHLDEVLELADRVTVLRDGRVVATQPVEGLTHTRLVELMLGREVEHAAVTTARTRTRAEAVFRVQELGGQVLHTLDLDVAPGDVVGIAGLTGSGREEVAGLLSGRTPRLGEVSVAGRSIPPGDPGAAISAGVCTLSDDRAGHALIAHGSVRENVTLADMSSFWSAGRFNRRAESAEVGAWISRLDVRPRDAEKPIGQLSGGNQQKAILARWLRLKPRVLILDEPTQGVDVGTTIEIHTIIDATAQAGTAVVVCSTDAEELARVCTEVIVLQRGRQVARLHGSDISVQRIESLQLAAYA